MSRQKPKRTSKARLTGKRYSVFLSHATYDKWIAQVICEKLEQGGVGTFRDDRDIHGGDSIPATIRDAIRECDEVVVLLTPQSIGREWVLVEIGIAIGAERRIVPLLYHVDADKIPSIIRGNRAFLLNELDKYIADLQSRIAGR